MDVLIRPQFNINWELICLGLHHFSVTTGAIPIHLDDKQDWSLNWSSLDVTQEVLLKLIDLYVASFFFLFVFAV